MIDKNLIGQIESELKEKGFTNTRVESIQAISGGSINEAYLLATKGGKYFVKLNHKDRFPNMFEKEKQGLEKLRETDAIRIPKVIAFGEGEEKAFLLMEFIEMGVENTNFWLDFGQKLAKLHLNSNSGFGLDHDNYIGSLKQPNKKHEDWESFFVEERLEYQAKMAYEQGLLDQKTMQLLDRLYSKLQNLFPQEPAALLHGDLWSGNFLVDEKNQAVLVDPAVYFGHREIDIAMTYLFGGFRPAFYQAYQDVYPMESGWEERIELCNLYPLLVHVNLFGGSYAGRVKNVLKRYAF